jgi:outer membrane immunogenic protein
MKRSLTLLAAAAIGLAASQASAADLPRRAPAPAYIPPPPPAYVWTGCYIGGNLGAAFGRFQVEDTTGLDIERTNTGFAGGGQIGCDYQTGAWVFGIRDMFDGTSLNKTRSFSDPFFSGDLLTIESKTRWFDTLTGRVGYLFRPDFLFYGQGGAAWAQTDLTFSDGFGVQVGEISRTKTGWTAGTGVEWMFAPHWSVFLEYNFMGFGTFSNAVTVCGLVSCPTLSAKASIQDLLVGVNYKF